MKKKLLRLIADLRFSIFIILLISVLSIIGTIIEQDQPLETYKLNYPLIKPMLGFLSWDFIIKFKLNHLYSNWWFLILIFLFGISLFTCSIVQQLPSLKIARRCQFFRISKQFYQLKIVTILNSFSFSKISLRLRKNNYSIFQQKNLLYCYKGLIGKLSPLIVHSSMILILIGTIFGSLFGVKAQELIPKTEVFHIQNILNGNNLGIIPNISSRLNDFWINYTEKETILQFYSDLSILDIYGNEIIRKTIYVNSPLIYKGIYYYQTDWELNGIRFESNKTSIFEYPIINILNNQKKLWLTLISNKNLLNNELILIIDNLQGYFSIYDKSGNFLGNLEINESYKNINILDILSLTGLQIKRDPGISIIYLGFFYLMISVFLSYETYSQIWILKQRQKLLIGGITNRATFDFELEFLKLIKK